MLVETDVAHEAIKINSLPDLFGFDSVAPGVDRVTRWFRGLGWIQGHRLFKKLWDCWFHTMIQALAQAAKSYSPISCHSKVGSAGEISRCDQDTPFWRSRDGDSSTPDELAAV